MSLNDSVECLSEALPVSGRASDLRVSFNQSLINSIRYLLSACEEVIPSDIYSQVTKKLDFLNSKSKLSGLLGVVHSDLFNAVEQEDVQKVNDIADRLAKDNFLINDISILNFSDFNDYYFPRIKPIFSQGLPQERINEIEYFNLSPEGFNRAKATIERGLKVIRASFPSFFEEYEELVSEIVILNAEGLKQGSSFELFGMIYKSSLFRSERVTDAIDFILHEQSHLYLHLLSKDDPIVINATERFESPLRAEKRPLIGIYHATFVLTRMHYVLTKALALHEIPEEEIDYCKELLDFYQKRCTLGLEILQKHAKMTPLGEALIQSAGKLIH